MRRLVVILLLISIIASPCYAFNIIDQLIYRKDVLRSNRTVVLVNRFTGEVKYLQRTNGQWVLLEGQWKEQYQKMYNAQNAVK